MNFIKRIPVFFLLAVSISTADQVFVKDGVLLKGTILEVTEEIIRLETDYAGTLEIDRGRVISFSSDSERYVRLESGTVFKGRARESEEAGAVILEGTDGKLVTHMSKVVESWGVTEKDPRITAAEKEAEKLERNWKVQSTARLSGREGNTKESSVEAGISAILEGPEDELRLSAFFERQTRDDVRTTDRKRADMRYTYYVYDAFGWYLRTGLERDRFQNISLRSTTAGGLSYRFANKDYYKLSSSLGVSYRYEEYYDATPSSDAIGMDAGLSHFYRHNRAWEVRNDLTYTPSFEDFGDYLFVQDSNISFPLTGLDMWKIRMGIRNEYNSMPKGDRKELDTIYYSSLVIDWL